MAFTFSIDEKVNKESRVCKLKLFILENFKCGGVIFEQVLSFPVLLKIFLRLISLTFQYPLGSLEQNNGQNNNS
ncbi:hypothetical protein DF185_00315 [Marinifilum breve]|uniref:Uncharacterized protein n=1 Tax=Marinifilum breve TaxID=2184082 RepID=A0A2V4A1F6_9BACT|nr:hypothetical protein DF185_00315 [Marinifilum breve]